MIHLNSGYQVSRGLKASCTGSLRVPRIQSMQGEAAQSMCVSARMHTLSISFSSLLLTLNISYQYFNSNKKFLFSPSLMSRFIIPLACPLLVSFHPTCRQEAMTNPTCRKVHLSSSDPFHPAPRPVRGLHHMLSLTNSPPSPCSWTDTCTRPALSSVTPLPVGVRFQWNAALKPFAARE